MTTDEFDLPEDELLENSTERELLDDIPEAESLDTVVAGERRTPESMEFAAESDLDPLPHMSTFTDPGVIGAYEPRKTGTAELPSPVEIPASAARNLLLPVGHQRSSGAEKLPHTPGRDEVVVQQLATATNDASRIGPEVPPVIVQQVPPKMVGRDTQSDRHATTRLRIEVEVTVANAERISRIAVEEAKAEFKKLASEATQRLDERFYEYRANQRVLLGR